MCWARCSTTIPSPWNSWNRSKTLLYCVTIYSCKWFNLGSRRRWKSTMRISLFNTILMNPFSPKSYWITTLKAIYSWLPFRPSNPSSNASSGTMMCTCRRTPSCPRCSSSGNWFTNWWMRWISKSEKSPRRSRRPRSTKFLGKRRWK